MQTSLLRHATLYTCFLLSGLFCFGGGGDFVGSLSGRVTASNGGAGVAAASVYIPDLKLGVITDAEGHYAFRSLPSGNFLVEVHSVGYKIVTRTVTISGAVSQDFALADQYVEESPVVGWLAEQDDEELELSDEDEHSQIAAAARAHLLVRVALLHRWLLDPAVPEHGRVGMDDIDSDPLHHLYADAVLDLGVEAVEAALPSAVGDALLPALRAVEAEADDAIDDLYQVLESLLTDDNVLPALGFLADVAGTAGPSKVAQTTRLLLNRPAELACVMVDRDDQDVDAVLRRFLVALSCAVSVEFAAELAAELPELTSADPRDEPALRHEAITWLGRIIEADLDPEFHATVVKAIDSCPAPGSDLLGALGHENPDPVAMSAPMSTSELTVAVVQALSALSLTARAPWLPLEFLVE